MIKLELIALGLLLLFKAVVVGLAYALTSQAQARKQADKDARKENAEKAAKARKANPCFGCEYNADEYRQVCKHCPYYVENVD